ncbi:acylphosphatase [Kaistia algarum]|uniref:acylphosphatase n=1 Tax=Kaistia algarum TaxID=2083279 RepID=UPI000CE81CA4|nr:acylphosphatase [Kaistia algarum]MCX5515264.1 acylphosphatase [Kaistia algarum]PPE77717.1 acylphosphatase [Kaistia algarum]
MTARIGLHVRVTGAVQGVGYRAFVEREAVGRGLSGWVRNRRDGSVEAVLSGDAEAVEAVLAAFLSGPRLARVAKVERIAEVEPIDGPFLVAPSH